MKLSKGIGLWTAYRLRLCELKIVAHSTLQNQANICAALVGSSMADKELEEVRKSDIELWMGERLQTCAPVTVRGEMNVLRQIINWLVDEGHLAAKPRFPTLSVPNTEKPLPGDAAFLWVLANVPQNIAAGLEFMMLTGLSPHELERLQKRDGPSTACLGNSIAIGLRPDFPVKQESRRRRVPLNSRAATLWHIYSMGTMPTHTVWPSVDAMQKAIRRSIPGPGAVIEFDPRKQAAWDVLPPAGVQRVTPKMMRKWFASKVAGEQPEHVLQRLMGHAPGSPVTRRHYVRSTDEQSTEAVRELKV